MVGTTSKAAVLVPAYRRPRRLDSLLSQLSSDVDRQILVSIDGPPRGAPEISREVAECRDVASMWERRNPNVAVRVSEVNLGCQQGVMSAISWGFEAATRLVVLEDDIKPGVDFLRYADAALDYFGSDSSVGSIAGYSDVPRDRLLSADHARRSIFSSSWGWATWSDRWQQLEPFLSGGMDFHLPDLLSQPGSWTFWKTIADLVRRGYIDSWAYPWLFLHWNANWTCITPPMPLVRNEGVGDASTHTRSLPTEQLPETGVALSVTLQQVFAGARADRDADLWSNREHHRATALNGARVAAKAILKRWHVA